MMTLAWFHAAFAAGGLLVAGPVGCRGAVQAPTTSPEAAVAVRSSADAPSVVVPFRMAVASEPQDALDAGGFEHAFERAATAISPSVVSITSTRTIDQGDLPMFLQPFHDGGGQELRGVGSGIILDETGHILTNNHVVEGASTIVVQLDDDREFPAKVIGADPKTDLAVVKIEATDLRPARTGDSDHLRVGQWVMAVGSPFNLPKTVTAGIVSAVGRGSMDIVGYGDFIQTDAAINQGNSGGPLVDLQGRVIGVNTAIASQTGGSNGIGFAIPINFARRIVGQLLEFGEVSRGWLGISMGNLTPELAQSFGYTGQGGVLVNDVLTDGPALKGGLKPGDIIVALAGQPVRDAETFRNEIAQTRPGTAVALEIWRGKQQRTLEVRLGTLQNEPVAKRSPAGKGDVSKDAKLGLSLVDPPPQMRQQGGEAGVLVESVARDSIAAEAGLREGDLITEVDGKPVPSVAQWKRVMERAKLDEGVRLRVVRGGLGHFVLLRRKP